MEKVLGLLLLVVYITAVVGLAAAITYAVIRIFPTQRAPSNPEDGESPPTSRTEAAMGKLFRRAKREAT